MNAGQSSWKGTRVFTIGHSTRTLDELVTLLRGAGVAILADIRTIPRSRRNPQFNTDTLGATLAPRGLRYAHLAKLGGLRRTRKDSPNTGWRNVSFRGYADYMLTEEFEAGLAELHVLTAKGTVALMCAESVPWRCHRSLVADALTARGAAVEHIIGSSRPSPHHMTAFARVRGTQVTYPVENVEDVPLAAPAPFHLEATVRVLQRRPTNRVEVWEDNCYRRALTTADGLVLIEVRNHGTIDEPDVRLAIRSGKPSAATRADIERIVRGVLGLGVDPAPLQRLAESQRALRPTAIALRGMRPPRFGELFEAFANVVPFQQLSIDAGSAIVTRLVERFGEQLEHESSRYDAFPTAHAVSGARLDTLRACGLSRVKAESLRYLARAIESGELTEAILAGLSTRDALKALVDLPGIGPWSAGLVLLRGLGRIDVFPPGDVGAEKGLKALLRIGPQGSLDRAIKRFGDKRGYLYFCALGSSLLAKGLIHAAPLVD